VLIGTRRRSLHR